MMTKKNSNTLAYAVILVLFILLFFVTKSPKPVATQLPVASAEVSIDDADIVKKLNLQSYNAQQMELADLQTKINDSTQLLYFKKSGKTVQVYLVKNDASETSQLQLTLDDTNSYDFNSTFDNLEIFTASNIGKIILNANSKWTENNYTSSKFPALLDWNADFAEKFNMLRREKVTQNNVQVSANTTKAIHFFLWSTLEYLKTAQQHGLYYRITKNNETYSATSTFYNFDHTTPRIQHQNDSLQQITQFKEKLQMAAVQKASSTVPKNESDFTSNILLSLGVLLSLFLFFREQFSKDKTPVTSPITDNSPKVLSKKEKAPKRTTEEIIQRKIRKIHSLEEVATLPWKASMGKELAFLINHQETVKKLIDAKDKNEETFLKILKEVFPSQITPLIAQKEKLQTIKNTNATLQNGLKNAETVPELLQQLHNWSVALNVENSTCKTLADQISIQQKNIQNEENTTKKLAYIQTLYHLITKDKDDVLSKLLTQFTEETQKVQKTNQVQLETLQKEAEKTIETIKTQAEKAYTSLENSKKISDNNNKLIEKYFRNLYDPYIKEFQNKARNFDHPALTKRLAFIAFNVMDLAKFINDDWSADAHTEGNIRSILRGESLNEVPKENYNPNAATSYLNTMVTFLHKNGVNEVTHLIDGVDINVELKSLH